MERRLASVVFLSLYGAVGAEVENVDRLARTHETRQCNADSLELPLGQSRNVAKLPDEVSARFTFTGAGAHKV